MQLLTPTKMGAFDLPNRIVMAPLTRSRASQGGLANDLMVEYYRQRATAGLIISEATPIVPQGIGYPRLPGIWNDEQAAHWKKVTDAVHETGGRIVLQLWHVGRVSHTSYQPSGELPVAPSAIAMNGEVRLNDGSRVPYETPRALDADEIPPIIAAYGQAARRAREAGFDGVEVHGANSYLPDQFLHDGSNHRTDEWGGSVENRARFLLEAVQQAVDAIGADRVGVRLSPQNSAAIWDSDPGVLFAYVATELGKLNLAYLHLREPLELEEGQASFAPLIKEAFGGPLILNGGYDRASGEKTVADNDADAIAYGVAYIANPDLPERFAENAPLNAPDVATFYSDGPQGYTTYPVLKK